MTMTRRPFDYSHRSMRDAHVEPIEDDLRILILAIVFVASAHFHGVHADRLTPKTVLKCPQVHAKWLIMMMPVLLRATITTLYYLPHFSFN